MESIITLTGNVAYSITLDPGVWIFDDRKVDLNTYFEESRDSLDELEEYTKAVSKHWDQEIKEGARLPEERKVSKKKRCSTERSEFHFSRFSKMPSRKLMQEKSFFSLAKEKLN